jgi:hypothetical protein
MARVNLDGHGYGLIDKTGKFSTYSSRDTKIICEKILEPYIQQISDYAKTIDKSSAPHNSFKIERPYLLISANSSECKDIEFITFSEGSFSEQSTGKLKTLVVEYEHSAFSRTYTRSNDLSSREAKVTSVGSYLIYFDVEKKMCIGHDVVAGPRLPDKIASSAVVSDMISTNKIKNKTEDFIRIIELRL